MIPSKLTLRFYQSLGIAEFGNEKTSLRIVFKKELSILKLHVFEVEKAKTLGFGKIKNKILVRV